MLNVKRNSLGPAAHLRSLQQSATLARALSGIPVWRQFLDMLLLRWPPCRLGSSEYYDYRLFEPGLTLAQKRRFVGWRGEPALDLANDPAWHDYADDKLRLHRLLARAALPHPQLHAVYGPTRPDAHELATEGVRLLATGAEVAAFLRGGMPYPCFAKPAHGGFGRGVYLVDHHERAQDVLVLHDGSSVRTDAFVDALGDPEGLGYLFQEVLRPHPSLAEITSGRLSSVRFMTLADRAGNPSVYRAVWKVPRASNIIDNFESGTTGNLLGQVDMDTGRVLRVIRGYGLQLQVLEVHPDSGKSCRGLTLPDWNALVDTVLACARLLPGFRFQHWDMALTDRGPVPLEVNLFAAGGTELSQLVEQRGILEPRLLDACKGR